MATIGNIVIGMSASTTTLQRDLNSGAAAITSFGARIQAGSVAMSGFFSTAHSAITAAVGSAIGAWVAGTAQAVDSAGDFADRVGTTTNAIMGLRYAAKLTGSESEALDGALVKMVANLGDAATKGGPAADALKGIGLDAAKLSRMDPAEAFAQIVEGLKAVPNPAQRAAAAMDIFGKGGLGLLGTINAGAGELRRLSGEFTSLGGVTEAQRQTIGKMYDSFDRLEAILTGLGARVAAAIAPGIGFAIDEFGKFFGMIYSTIDGMNELIKTASGGRLQLGAPAAAAAAGPGADIEAIAEAEAARVRAGNALVAKLKEQRDTYGMAAIAADIYPAKQAGAAAETLKEAEAIAQTIDALDEKKKAEEKAKTDAKSLTESIKSPLDQFRSQLSLINQLRESGNITAGTAAKAASKAQADFMGDFSKRRAAALDIGSKEARSAILDHQAGRTSDEAKKTARAAEATAKATAKTASLLDKLIEQVGKFQATAEPVM